jgi:hypothetical protein
LAVGTKPHCIAQLLDISTNLTAFDRLGSTAVCSSMLVVLREQTDPSDYAAACRVARVARIAAMRWPRHTKASACINSQFRPSSSLSDQQPKDERWLRAEFLPPLEFGPPLATADNAAGKEKGVRNG